MPTRPPRACTFPGCPSTVTGRGGYCQEHRGAVDEARGNRHARGYGNEWAKISRYYLAHHPVCADPYNRHVGEVVASKHTDHIVPKAAGGRDEWSNFQALCHSCHSYKTFVVERERG
jgi:5-methylcytosine-specific restriction protein A